MLAALKAVLHTPGLRQATDSWNIPVPEQSTYAVRVDGAFDPGTSASEVSFVLKGSVTGGKPLRFAESSSDLKLSSALRPRVEPVVELPALTGFRLLPTDIYREVPTVANPLRTIVISIGSQDALEPSDSVWTVNALFVDDMTLGESYRAVLPENGLVIGAPVGSIELSLEKIPPDEYAAAREAEALTSWKVAHAAELLPVPL